MKARGFKALYPGVQTGGLLTLSGSITQTTVRRLARVLDSAEGPITLSICSTGGDIDAAMGCHELLRLRREAGGQVTVIGAGVVMSAAVLLLVSGTPGHRYLTKATRLMYHSSSLRVMGAVKARALRTEVKALEDFDLVFDKLVSQYTGLPLAAVRKLSAGEDQWLTAAEARAMGFVDGVL